MTANKTCEYLIEEVSNNNVLQGFYVYLDFIAAKYFYDTMKDCSEEYFLWTTMIHIGCVFVKCDPRYGKKAMKLKLKDRIINAIGEDKKRKEALEEVENEETNENSCADYE